MLNFLMRLSFNARMGLEKMGFAEATPESVARLLNSYSEADLLRRPYFGKKALAELRAFASKSPNFRISTACRTNYCRPHGQGPRIDT
jgi:hypothetical protein